MGIAAYNRGSALISRQFAGNHQVHALRAIADRLTSVPKHPDAPRPWGDVRLERGHGGWWLTCPSTGFGYWYRTASAAMRDWNVYIAEVDIEGFTCRPVPA